MAKFKQLYKIIEEVIDNISWIIPINSSVLNGNTYTLSVDNTAYLNNQTIIDIDGYKWEVVDFTFNEELKIKAYNHNELLTSNVINLSSPNFIHGTVRMANSEYTENINKQSVLPLVYLYETQNENVSLDSKDFVERTANARIFILMSNDFKNFIQIDYDKEIYEPLSNIEDKIVSELLNNSNIGKFTSPYTRINHDQFAYTDRNGHLNRIFSDELSALELNIPLNIVKCCNN